MFVTELYNEIFDKSGELKNQIAASFNVRGYRVKTIKSGSMLEAEIYPIWNTAPAGIKELEKERKPTRTAQRNLNDKNAKKRFMRLLHTNFEEGDAWFTLTYKQKNLPKTVDEARKDMSNFIRRVKRLLEKYGVGAELLKYLYITEGDDEGKGRRLHLHFVSNFTAQAPTELRSEIFKPGFWRKLWKKGYVSLRPLDFGEFGLTGLAVYSMKDPKGAKRWGGSRNLKEPREYISDTKISRRKVKLLATDEGIHQEIFEKLYSGYKYLDTDVRHSDFVSGAYVYVRMRKEERRC